MALMLTAPVLLQLSPEAQHLLHHMFRPNPAERCTTEDVMAHPWFTKNLPPELTSMNDRLLAARAAEHADVVVGARFAGRGDYVATGPRRWAMRLLALVLSRLTGTALTDPTSGLRMATRPAIAVFARHYPEEYLGDTVESLVIAHRVGLRIAQVPAVMRARTTGQASTSPVRSAVYLLRVVSAVLLALVREVPDVDARDLAATRSEVTP